MARKELRKELPKKRGKIYFANVMVDDFHIRESLGTGDWQQALSEQARLVRQAEEGQIAKPSSIAYGRLKYPIEKALDALISHQQEAGRSDPVRELSASTAKDPSR